VIYQRSMWILDGDYGYMPLLRHMHRQVLLQLLLQLNQVLLQLHQMLLQLRLHDGELLVCPLLVLCSALHDCAHAPHLCVDNSVGVFFISLHKRAFVSSAHKSALQRVQQYIRFGSQIT
jgi:hypothetical protein